MHSLHDEILGKKALGMIKYIYTFNQHIKYINN